MRAIPAGPAARLGYRYPLDTSPCQPRRREKGETGLGEVQALPRNPHLPRRGRFPIGACPCRGSSKEVPLGQARRALRHGGHRTRRRHARRSSSDKGKAARLDGTARLRPRGGKVPRFASWLATRLANSGGGSRSGPTPVTVGRRLANPNRGGVGGWVRLGPPPPVRNVDDAIPAVCSIGIARPTPLNRESSSRGVEAPGGVRAGNGPDCRFGGGVRPGCPGS